MRVLLLFVCARFRGPTTGVELQGSPVCGLAVWVCVGASVVFMHTKLSRSSVVIVDTGGYARCICNAPPDAALSASSRRLASTPEGANLEATANGMRPECGLQRKGAKDHLSYTIVLERQPA